MQGNEKKISNITLPMEAQGLVPHAGKMLFINELSEYVGDNAYGTSRITEDNPFVDSTGKVEDVLFIELMAQLAAAARGYDELEKKGPAGTGYIGSITDVNIYKPATLGDELELGIEKILEMDGVTVANGTVSSHGELCASGRLKVFVTDALQKKEPLGEDANYHASSRASAGVDGRSPIFSEIKKSALGISVSDDKKSASCDFFFDADFLGFDGHFPRTPVLSGIVMLDMVIVLIEAFYGMRVALSSLHSAKFLQVISKEETVSVFLKPTKEDSLIKVSCEFSVEGKQAAKFIMTLKPDEKY